MRKQIKKFRTLMLLVAFLFTSSSTLFAQTDSIKWGIEQEYQKKGLIYEMEILKVDNNFIYYFAKTVKFVSDNSLLIRYEKSTGISTFIEIKSEVKEYTLVPELRKFYDNQYHLFSSYYNKATNKVFLFHQSYSLEKFESNNDIRKVAEIDLNELGGSGHSDDNYFLIFDNSQFLLRYSCETNKQKSFGLEIFDKSFNRKWKSSAFAVTEAGVNFEQGYKIDNDGNVYAIQRNYENEKDVDKHFDRSRVWIAFYPKDGGATKTIPLILKDDKFIRNAQLILTNTGDVVCAGLYANPGTISAVGCFSFSFDSKLSKLKSVDTKAFSSELLTKGMEIKLADKEIKKITSAKDFDVDFSYLAADSVYYSNDGSFTLTYEKFKGITYVTNGNPQNFLYYDDLFVLTFNSVGNIKWVQKIPKYEYVMNANNYIKSYGNHVAQYFGYYDIGNNLHFIFNIYNDTSRSIFKWDEVPKNAKTVEITLDRDGNEHFRELVADSKIAGITCPRFFYKTDYNTIITTKYFSYCALEAMGRSKNKLTFGELKIK